MSDHFTEWYKDVKDKAQKQEDGVNTEVQKVMLEVLQCVGKKELQDRRVRRVLKFRVCMKNSPFCTQALLESLLSFSLHSY